MNDFPLLSRRTCLGGSLAGTAALMLPFPSAAQGKYPTKLVRIVVGFTPGGSGDFIARVLTVLLTPEFGAPIIVDNKPGAGSNIATQFVAKAERDGHTLLLGGNFSHAVNPVLYKNVNFDPVKDFTPITKLADLPSIIAVNPSFGVRTLKELIAKVKAEPGRWNYSTPGNGTPSHLAGAVLSRLTGAKLTHIPYRGGAPAVLAAIAGEVQFTIGTPPAVLPHVSSGRLLPLSMTTSSRSPVIPGVPGAEEAGVPGFDVQGWWGLWAPAGIPGDVRDQLHATVVKVLNTSRGREQFSREGLTVATSTSPSEFEAYIAREIPIWARIVRDSGAVAE